MKPRICMEWRFATMILILCAIMITSCSKNEEIESLVPTDPKAGVILLPVVIHVIHSGESDGEGSNLSEELIERQIEILNDDFTRKEGTRGFNDHPD